MYIKGNVSVRYDGSAACGPCSVSQSRLAFHRVSSPTLAKAPIYGPVSGQTSNPLGQYRSVNIGGLFVTPVTANLRSGHAHISQSSALTILIAPQVKRQWAKFIPKASISRHYK